MRRRYLVDWSVQVKYMVMVILPVIIVGLASIYIMRNVSKLSLEGNRERLLTEIGILQMGIQSLEEVSRDPKKLALFKTQLAHLRDMARSYILMTNWAWQKIQEVIIIDIFILVFGGLILAIIFSHRIAGPVSRVKRYLEMLSKGQGIPPVRVRGYDEFKDLASALEDLRKFLINRQEKAERAIKELQQDLSQYKKILKEEKESSPEIIEELSSRVERNLENLKSHL